MKESLLILFGFLLGLVPPWFQRKWRLRTHWCALRVEIQQCKEKAETLLRDNVMSPLYRLPVVAYEVSFPVLLADGAVQEKEVAVIGRFFNQAQDINRGLDNASEMLKAGDEEKLKQAHDRNCLKARGLIESREGQESLYDQIKKIVDSKVTQRWDMNKKGWLRLVVVLSCACIVGISGLALYEKVTWEPTGHNLEGNQFFFYYYPVPEKQGGFVPLLKNFNEKKFVEAMLLPLIVLWVVYGFLFYGGRWVYSGFKRKSTK